MYGGPTTPDQIRSPAAGNLAGRRGRSRDASATPPLASSTVPRCAVLHTLHVHARALVVRAPSRGTRPPSRRLWAAESFCNGRGQALKCGRPDCPSQMPHIVRFTGLPRQPPGAILVPRHSACRSGQHAHRHRPPHSPPPCPNPHPPNPSVNVFRSTQNLRPRCRPRCGGTPRGPWSCTAARGGPWTAGTCSAASRRGEPGAASPAPLIQSARCFARSAAGRLDAPAGACRAPLGSVVDVSWEECRRVSFFSSMVSSDCGVYLIMGAGLGGTGPAREGGAATAQAGP
jgi:hypothetical protein